MPEKRQRVMIIGDSGTGKSHAALSYVDEHLSIYPDAKIAVVDCDDSLDAVLDEQFPDVKAKLHDAQGKPQNWWKITSYNALLSATTKAQQILKVNDVLIFEGLERGWELAQDHYTEEVFGKTSGQHLATLRQSAVAAAKVQSPVSYDSARDWPSIRKLWKNDILIPLTVASPWHVVATASSKPVVLLNERDGTYNVNPFLKAIFGEVGIAPEGEKADVKRFELAVCLGIKGSSNILSIAKNRGTRLRPMNVNWTHKPFWSAIEAAIRKAQGQEEKDGDNEAGETISSGERVA